MNYELKAPKGRHILFTVLFAGLMVIACFAVYVSIQSGDMINVIFSFCYLALGGVGFIISYNNVGKCLTFNNVSFTFEGKTYTYQQIERIALHGGRYGRVYYKIYVDGKRLFTFENDYIGAREFFYYLDFYKVPGAPRG